MNGSIVNAIKERRRVNLRYPPGRRLIEPHAYGESADGKELLRALRAYQINGASDSGGPVGWKMFHVDRIESMEVLDNRFVNPRPGYSRGDRAMKGRIFAQL